MGKGKFSMCLPWATGGDGTFLTEGQEGRLRADTGANKSKWALDYPSNRVLLECALQVGHCYSGISDWQRFLIEGRRENHVQ